MLFTVEFITYQGVYKSIETDKLNIPTSEGRRTILSNHMPIMIPIQIGVIETSNNNKTSHYAISGGVLYFDSNVAEIVADDVVDLNEININEITQEKQITEEKYKKVRRANEKHRIQTKLDSLDNLINAYKKYVEVS